MSYVEKLIFDLSFKIKKGINLQEIEHEISKVPIFKFFMASDSMVKEYLKLPNNYGFYTKVREEI